MKYKRMTVWLETKHFEFIKNIKEMWRKDEIAAKDISGSAVIRHYLSERN